MKGPAARMSVDKRLVQLLHESFLASVNQEQD
jgi:hypothetical protein